MGYVVSVIFLSIAVISKLKYKNWHNPLSFMLFLWGVISFFSEMQLFGSPSTSFFAWLLLLLGFSSYALGCVLGYRITIKPHVPYIYNNKYSLNENLISFVVLFLYIFSIIYIYDIRDYLFIGISITRRIYFNDISINTSLNSGWVNVIFRFLYEPLLTMLRAIFVYLVFFPKKKNIKLIISIAVLFLIELLITGGRFAIFSLFLQLFVGFAVSKRIELTRKTKKRVIIFVFFAIAILIAILYISSIARSNNNLEYTINSFGKTIYRYFTLEIPHLDYRVKNLNSNYNYGFGINSFSGIIGPIMFVLTRLTPIGYSNYYIDSVNMYSNIQTSVNLGDEVYFNAFVSPVYPLYFDFNLIGVIIGMIIMGWVMMYLYKNRHNNSRNLALFIFSITAIGRSISSYFLSDWSFVIGFVFIYFFFVKNKKNKYISIRSKKIHI